MGFLANAVTAILGITGPIIQETHQPLPHIRTLQTQICPFGSQANWLLQNTPIDVLPPKPTFHNSEDIYDSENRTDAYDPVAYPIFERILLPLNTMNIFGQNITIKPTNPTCQIWYMNVIQRWAAQQALTGKVNSYSILVHRITIGDLAQNYLAVAPAAPLTKPRHRAIRNWFNTLNGKVTDKPSPYQNNFRIWDFRALVSTAYTDYKPTLPYLSQIQIFLQSVITPGGIITSEIRGSRTIQYHIYFLAPLFDTLYLIFTDTRGRRLQARHINLVEGVMRNLEKSLTDPSAFFMAAGFVEQLPTSKQILDVLRDRWNCVAIGLGCRTSYTRLLEKLAGRRFI
jgi:hypothetical protein